MGTWGRQEMRYPPFMVEFENMWEGKSYTSRLSGIRPGWHGLIRETLRRIRETDPDVRIERIEQRNGQLHIHLLAPQSAHVWDIAEEALARSSTICEICGQPGEVRHDYGWSHTLCDEHHLGLNQYPGIKQG
ncbi:MAG: hypothetical protein ACLFNV_11270 [Desulfovibrionales bacterium]